jgi:hypothetical protein
MAKTRKDAAARQLSDAQIWSRVRNPEPVEPEEQRATAARYLADRNALEVTLPSGVAVVVPVAILPPLVSVSPSILSSVVVSPGGWGLMWDAIDVHLEVEGVLDRALWPQPRAAIRELARAAGRTRSPARARASRANGKKGGRPRKTPARRS